MSDDDALAKLLRAEVLKLLDDPTELEYIIKYACQRNPDVAQNTLLEFVELGQIHDLIKDNAPKIATWVAQASLGQPITNATNQFVTHVVTQVKAHVDGLGATAVDNIRFVQKMVAEKYPEALADINHWCGVACDEVAIDTEERKRELIGSLKTQAYNVGDMAKLVVQNAMLVMDAQAARDATAIND